MRPGTTTQAGSRTGNMFRRLAPSQLLQVDALRFLVTWSRYSYFARTRGLTTLSGEAPDVSPLTVEHNLKGLRDLTVARSRLLLRPLSVIEAIPADAKVLAIGPRSEGELLNLVGHGFKKANIRGLDLISYSPWVDLGDMHAMPYADNSWDVVVLAWVLAYSDNWAQAVSEVVRVARPGAVVAAGVEYNPRSADEIAAEEGYRVGNKERIRSTEHLLELFGDHVDAVYFRHDVQPSRRDSVGGIAVVFSIRKAAS